MIQRVLCFALASAVCAISPTVVNAQTCRAEWTTAGVYHTGCAYAQQVSLVYDNGDPGTGGSINSCLLSCTYVGPHESCNTCETASYCTGAATATPPCPGACEPGGPGGPECDPPGASPNGGGGGNGGGGCANYRADPVNVGSGAFITEPRVDVLFEGSRNPIRFARTYTSLDAAPRPGPLVASTRLAPGWYHTFDERLFADDARSATTVPTADPVNALEIVRRRPTGGGQRFSCPPPHDPAAGVVFCDALDGSTSKLAYDPALGEWQVRHGDGVWISFSYLGSLRSSFDRAGQGWTVTYIPSGSQQGLIDYVQDHLGRTLYFIWDVPTGGDRAPAALIELRDAPAGTVLASFTHTDTLLTAASSRAGTESYGYLETAAGGGLFRQWSLLDDILRDGQVETHVDYELWPATGYPTGRVVSVSADSGSFDFRYMGADDNLCNDAFSYDESRTQMVVDRSVPASPTACDVDGDCGATEACSPDPAAAPSVGFCRPFACQQYVTPAGASSVSRLAIGDISGNCPCGNAQQRAWSELGNGAIRVTSLTERDGTVTSYAHDALGRLTERCAGDDDTDPATCTAAGAVWTRWSYHPTFPERVTLVERRSRLSTTGDSETEYEYDAVTGRLRFIRRIGYTRDLADALVGPVTETTELVYDASGRLSERLGPRPGERTVYTYWPSGGGAESGLLRYVDRFVDATLYLRQSFSGYTATGLPQTIVDEAGVTTTLAYNAYGQLSSSTVAGQATSYAYDPAGRLKEITEPSGRRVAHFYDGAGRLERTELRDTPGAGQADRVRYVYDAAGRRTAMHIERIDAGGAVIGTTFTWTATYDNHGDRATDQVGPQLPNTYGYDSNGLGRLESLVRGDGDPEDFTHDLHGRALTLQRTFSAGVTGTHTLAYDNAAGSGIETGGALPTRVTTPSATARDYVYDDFGRLVRSDSPEWGTARWRWVDGQLTEELRPDGKRTAYTYDLTGRPTLIDRDADNPGLVGQDLQLDYDNGASGVPCVPSTFCTYRVGRLARVGIEYAPGLFWSMYYDYDVDGRTRSEVYPDGREAIYTYDASGRLTDLALPALPNDSLRFDYDTVAGDAHDPGEIVQVTHERGGGDHVYWARDIERDSLSRVTHLRTHDDSASPVEAAYRTDGRLDSFWVYRNGASPIGVAHRSYGYSDDGTAVGYTSAVGSDPPRTYFYDQANRLACAASTYGAPSCPTNATLVESYVHDTADRRTASERPAGSTTISLNGDVLDSTSGPAGDLAYGYALGAGGPRDWDDESSAPSAMVRLYGYDGAGRLSLLEVDTADPFAEEGGELEHHILTILYDHLSRPLMVIDANDSTGGEECWQYYWSGDELLHLIHTPDATKPDTYDLDTYVPLAPMLLGRLLTQYVGGAGAGEEWMYYATAPEGRPIAGYAFEVATGSTSEVWRADRTPFGETIAESTFDAARYRPPQLFAGQLVLPGSAVGRFEDEQYVPSRPPLWLNVWRVYDPQVGQYLQPEPLLVEGSVPQAPSYAYAATAPLDAIDPDGRNVVTIPDTVNTHCPHEPAVCAAIRELPKRITNIWDKPIIAACQDDADEEQDEEDEDEEERCRRVLDMCIEYCLSELPTRTPSGDPFFRCRRQCLRRNGC